MVLPSARLIGNWGRRHWRAHLVWRVICNDPKEQVLPSVVNAEQRKNMPKLMLSLLLLLAATGPVVAQEPATEQAPDQPAESSDPNAKPLSFWMNAKLEYSTAILRGMAMADFEAVKSNAEKMRLLNKVEGFVRRRNPDYSQQVDNFEQVTKDLVRQAELGNVDGIALEFSQLTLSCVRCHQVLRVVPLDLPAVSQ